MPAVGVHVQPAPPAPLPVVPRLHAGGMWDANPRGGTSCLPSSDEHSGWWDKERNLLDDSKAISCVGFPKWVEVEVLGGFWVGWVTPPSALRCVQPVQPAEA